MLMPLPHQSKPLFISKKETGTLLCATKYRTQKNTPTTRQPTHSIGIDMNVGQITTSEGMIIRQPNTKSLEDRKKRFQKKLALQQKGSNRRKKTLRTIALRSIQIANKRKTWSHKVSTNIAKRYETVFVEDLKIVNMTKSAKGTIENPGKNVAQKRGLNRVIAGSNWGQLKTMLEYKAQKLVKVAPHFTSQECSECGHTEKDNRKTQASFKCLECKYEVNADVNASINVLNKGLVGLGNRTQKLSGSEASMCMEKPVSV